MSRLILIQEDDFERQYRESMAYLDSKYRDLPSRLKNIPLTEAEQILLATHSRFPNIPAGYSGPIGKLVI